MYKFFYRRFIPILSQFNPYQHRYLYGAAIPIAYISNGQRVIHAKAEENINDFIVSNDYKNVRLSLDSNDNEQSKRYNKLGWTPLILAVARDNYPIAKLLLNNGADPDSQDKYQRPTKQRISRNEAFFSKVRNYHSSDF